MKSLFYRELGKGKILVIIHGLYGCSDNWLPVAKLLSKDFNVIIPDLPNHGQSYHTEQFSIDFLADSVFDFMNSLKIKKAYIVGHSLGGKVAITLASKYPQMVEKLVVVDIAPRPYKYGEFDNRKLHLKILENLKKIDLKKYKNRSEVVKNLHENNNEKLKLIILKNLKKTPEGLEWKINLEAIYNGLNNILNNFNVDIKKIKADTLFIKAENSPYINEKDIKFIKENMKNAKTTIIEGVTHWLHSEKPQELANIISKFLRE